VTTTSSTSDDHIGTYRLERLLGRGTMASVYLGTSTQLPVRSVAIKRVHVLAGEADHERLRREAVTMSELNHPNAMPILEVVADGDGIALVLPYAANGSLTQRLAAKGSLAPIEAVNVIGPIADALSAAHEAGILHRDVKPSNILFTSNDTPLLADFGIASNPAHTNLTRTDVAIGTAGYLDPDLADGLEPSPQSDLYALGVVAYETLAGRAPFAGQTPLAVVRAADRGSFQELNSGIPALDAAIHKAFARNRANRWTSVRQFAEAIREAVPEAERPNVLTRSAAANQPGIVLTKPTTTAPGNAVTALDGTTTFRRRTQQSTISDATPAKPTHRRWKIGAGLAAVTAVAGTLFAVSQSGSNQLAKLPVPELPDCSAETNAQCVEKTVRTATGVKVTFANGTNTNYRVGESNDAIRVANFFCGERATLSLYKPETGRLFYLSNWPDPTSDEVSEALFDDTEIVGAQISVGDQNGDGCADIALDKDGVRTWILPHVQQKRLAPATLSLKLGGNS
jgi:serine/threonine protein kinase